MSPNGDKSASLTWKQAIASPKRNTEELLQLRTNGGEPSGAHKDSKLQGKKSGINFTLREPNARPTKQESVWENGGTIVKTYLPGKIGVSVHGKRMSDINEGTTLSGGSFVSGTPSVYKMVELKLICA